MSREQYGVNRKKLEKIIEEKRKKLDCAIEAKADYEVVYELSLEVDKVIEDYIQMNKKEK
ncbi:MAG: Spo0E family sporulation regulatory protein-aspartic acid phosphatase [Lachnospiraceae bacterium]|nr:Spo0E family sporulation regulatory protein-aspartic acid phosphatase [Lachnospiraceae bacterium]